MKILLTGAFKYSDEQISKIRSLGFSETFVKDERIELDVDASDFDCVVCNSIFAYNDISKFKNLKFIQLTSAGMDRAPLDYIFEHNIKLENARGVYSIPIAEHVVLKALEIYNKSRYFYKQQDERIWKGRRDLKELYGKKAAIIGFGSIGFEIAKRLFAFGVSITAVDMRELSESEAEIIDNVCTPDRIDEILPDVDIAVLALPLTKQTHHYMDRHKLSLMKQDSIIVNISRGAIIDEVALIELLKGDRLLGAALDVFEQEPLPKDSPLWGIENVIVTPHNSYLSDKVHKRLFDLIYKNLSEFANNYK